MVHERPLAKVMVIRLAVGKETNKLVVSGKGALFKRQGSIGDSFQFPCWSGEDTRGSGYLPAPTDIMQASNCSKKYLSILPNPEP